jgi:hypothetical protein
MAKTMLKRNECGIYKIPSADLADGILSFVLTGSE